MTTSRLAALQLPNGGFESVVLSPRGRSVDCNGFTAALVLRQTRHVPHDAVMAAVRNRALGYLTTCASPTVPEAFAFWPDCARPSWAAQVPADVDDTAIMLFEFFRYGWIDRAAALRRFCRAVLPQRVSAAVAGRVPSWIVPGCFSTWIGPAVAGFHPDTGVNIVDTCVNTNVVALMACLGAQHLPGYDAAILTIQRGLRWAEDDAKRLSAITPFYPSVQSLVEALEHAVECGVHPLGDTLRRMRPLIATSQADAGCCRSAYGATVWHCEALDLARALARLVDREAVNSSDAGYAAT